LQIGCYPDSDLEFANAMRVAVRYDVEGIMATRATAIIFFHVTTTFLFLAEASSQLEQQGPKLVSAGATGNVNRGYALGVSADGATAIVGAPGDGGGLGAAWVWTRSGGTWSQGPKLVGSGAVPVTNLPVQQGSSVAISADGSTIMVGGMLDNHIQGAVWVWVRNGNAWMQQGPKLVGSGALGAVQGSAVALSADGNTAIVGGTGDNGGKGAAWIWTRNSGTWSQQGPKLIGTGAIDNPGSQQGRSVAISADGNTVIVGGDNDNNAQGAAWVWTRSGGTWTQQGNKLVGSGGVGAAAQGQYVALSADGNTALVGGITDNNGIGAAWAWTRSGGVWTQQGSKLVGTGATGNALQGSVALSNDGNTAVIGGRIDNSFQGAMWVWTRNGSSWSQQGAKLVGNGASVNDEQGFSVALSGDGNTALSGGPFDTGAEGAVWVWTSSGAAWSQQGGKLVGTGGIPSAAQGSSVALSADGNTSIIGGPADSGSLGAAWIWTRNGNWTEQAKLVGTGAVFHSQGFFFAPDPNQGAAVALSADGNTAMVGGPGDDNNQGAAWVWTRSGSIWTQQGPKLVGTGAPFAYQGTSVSLSADGNTAIVGGTYAWAWTRNGSTWAQQGPKLVGTGAIGSVAQADSVAVSGDGNTAITGSPDDNAGQGAAWIWTRSGGVWTQQGPKLIGTGAVGAARQGSSVAISADGNNVLVGGYADNGFAGAVWVWTRRGIVWMQQGSKLVGTGAISNSYQGTSVALSADGNRAIVGAFGQQAAWIWARNGGTWTQQGSKLVGTGAIGFSGQGSSVSLSSDGATALIGGPYDNQNQGAAWVFAIFADLSVSETVNPSIQAVSGQVSYTITVTNGGPSLATNVTLTDAIPAGSTLLSDNPSQGTCHGVNTVICSIGDMASGSTMTITLVLSAPGTPTTLTNTASVSGTEPDPNPADNTASASVPIVQSIPAVSPGLLALLLLLLAAAGATAIKAGP
jgi:uncharacterized repeat protein (TIGR01451 family)